MFYVWIVLALIAAVVIVPVIIGLLLPVRYCGQVKVVFCKPPGNKS